MLEVQLNAGPLLSDLILRDVPVDGGEQFVFCHLVRLRVTHTVPVGVMDGDVQIAEASSVVRVSPGLSFL